MKRSAVLLAGMLAMILLLAGGLLLLRDIPEEPEGPASANREQVRLMEDLTAIDALEVDGPLGTYRLTVAPDGSATVEGIEPAYLDQTAAVRAANAVRSLAGKPAGETDLAQYGLEAPETVMTIRSGGDDRKLLVGNEAPGGYGRYVRVDGTTMVYVTPGLEDALKSKLDFVDRKVVDAPAAEGVVPASLVLGGTARTQEIVFGIPGGGSDGVVSPVQLRLLSHHSYSINYEGTVEVLQGLFHITAEAVACYNPTQEELEAYGFAEPYASAAYCWEGGKCTLLASRPQDGGVYLMRQGVPVIYTISASALPWLDWQYADVVTRFLLLPDIYTLSGVELESRGERFRYTLFSTDGELLSVEDGQGSAIAPDAFKAFYQCLIGIPAETYEPGPTAQEEAVLQIAFLYADGGPTDTLELTEGPPLQAYLTVNGVTEFLTKSKYVDVILENARRLPAGEGIVPLY